MLDVRAISGYYNQIRLARSMGSGDDMFRTWSGPEGSSHKEPLPGTRSHRAHGAFFCVDSLSSGLPRLVGRRPQGALDHRPARADLPCRYPPRRADKSTM